MTQKCKFSRYSDITVHTPHTGGDTHRARGLVDRKLRLLDLVHKHLPLESTIAIASFSHFSTLSILTTKTATLTLIVIVDIKYGIMIFFLLKINTFLV